MPDNADTAAPIIWNVSVPVIALVSAATAEEAIAKWINHLDRLGLHVYNEDGNADAFETDGTFKADL